MKAKSRKELLTKRNKLSEEEIESKSRMIQKRLFSLTEFKEATFILFYAAVRSEAKTEMMIKDALASGKRVALPIVSKKDHLLLISELKDYDKELAPGHFNIPEQMEEYRKIREVDEIDLFILPGVGFDENGNRLGYGGGFYDRLLSKVKRNIPLVALAYEIQIIPEIHINSYDVRVDKIVTEERIIVT